MINAITKLDHINFTVSDFKQSVDWYHEIFNFELVESGTSPDNIKWGILKSGDAMLAISEESKREHYKGDQYHQTYHIGLRLKDRGEWEELLEKNELQTFHSSPVHYPNSLSWYIKDPSGHMIEVAIWNDNLVKF